VLPVDLAQLRRVLAEDPRVAPDLVAPAGVERIEVAGAVLDLADAGHRAVWVLVLDRSLPHRFPVPTRGSRSRRLSWDAAGTRGGAVPAPAAHRTDLEATEAGVAALRQQLYEAGQLHPWRAVDEDQSPRTGAPDVGGGGGAVVGRARRPRRPGGGGHREPPAQSTTGPSGESQTRALSTPNAARTSALSAPNASDTGSVATGGPQPEELTSTGPGERGHDPAGGVRPGRTGRTRRAKDPGSGAADPDSGSRGTRVVCGGGLETPRPIKGTFT
jgi:hypothetical protein